MNRINVLFLTCLTLFAGACQTTLPPDMQKLMDMNNLVSQLPAEEIPAVLASSQSAPYYHDLADFALLKGLYENNLDLIDVALQQGASPKAPLVKDGTAPTSALWLLDTQLYNRWFQQQGSDGITEYVTLRELQQLQYGIGKVAPENVTAFDLVRSQEARTRLEQHQGESLSQANRYNALALAVYLQDQPMIDYWKSQGLSVNHAFPTGYTLLHIAALAGKPRSIDYLVAAGADVNVRRTTPQDGDKFVTFENGTILHSLIYETSITNDSRVAVIKALADNRANPNIAVPLSVYQYQRHQVTVDLMTPLHVQAFREGNASPQVAQGTGMFKVRQALLDAGANPMALNARGRTPGDILHLAAQARQEKERKDRQPEKSGINPSRLFAGAAMLGLGAYGASQGGELGARAIEIGGAGMADIVSGGQTNHSQQVLQDARQNRQQTAAASTAATPPALQTENYRFTCPSGVEGNAPLTYSTQTCRAAQVDFARTYACNDYKRFETVQASCHQACGTRDCQRR